jgi:orotate phosphoribosyltransferase
MKTRPSHELAKRILAVSEIRGEFVLSSGRRSGVYFDKFRFLADPDLLREVAGAVRDALPEGITHLAAPEGAATLLVAAVALETGLPVAVVRKEAKTYGTMARVEGYAPSGAVAALIEDVGTTGGQVLAAARALETVGVTVAMIILALDRGGAVPIRRAGYQVRAVATVDPAVEPSA